MKKLILSFVVGLLIFSAVAVSAATTDDVTKEFNSETATKEEAIVYIEKSLSDPQIKQWVTDKFGSEKLFLLSLKLAPEKTVKEIASTFSNFQKVGGAIAETGAEWAVTIIIIIEFIVTIGLIIAAVVTIL
jgi:hypothetical protein